MKPPRRERPLSAGETRLWREVAKRFTPLPGRAKPAAIEIAETAPPPPAARAVPANPPRTPPRPSPPPSPPPQATAAPFQAPPQQVAPAVGLERQARLRLRRGRLAIEARLDLHGMVQAQAHAALTGFLLRSRAAGHTYVLVVTGKGGVAYGDPFRERGVLRRSVPHWLRGAELRGIVIGFEEASRHHGGSGALYVRLRRR